MRWPNPHKRRRTEFVSTRSTLAHVVREAGAHVMNQKSEYRFA